MKIGVISDTHIPERAAEIPKKILSDFKNVDMIIHAGDIQEWSVLQALESACKNVVAVCGNMDSHEIRRKLKQKEIIKVGKKRIGVTHGMGAPAALIDHLERLFHDDKVDVVIFGHSHVATQEMKGGVLYFNPGSPTDKMFSPYNSYGIIEINDTAIKARIIKL